MLEFAVAALCAGTMGFAIQRGGTCLVAAVDEVVSNHTTNRLIALGEASLLVASGIVAAQLAGLLSMPPHAFASTLWTLAGGLIMGLGAFVAGACVFGAIARIGNGEFAFALVPAGFFLGCAFALRFGMNDLPRSIHARSLVISHSALFAGPLLLLVIWRLWRTITFARRRDFTRYVWSPHVATGVIGTTFVILFLTVGAWNYTDYLAEAARQMSTRGLERGALLLALFIGALLGGLTADRLRASLPSTASLVRCLVGGIMLGLGGSLVPGANDGLILLGLPLLYPHAWLAFASMLISIAAAMLVRQRWTRLARASVLA